MKTVHVLGRDARFVVPESQVSERFMRRIGSTRAHNASSPVVPLPDQTRISVEGLGSRKLLRTMGLP